MPPLNKLLVAEGKENSQACYDSVASTNCAASNESSRNVCLRPSWTPAAQLLPHKPVRRVHFGMPRVHTVISRSEYTKSEIVDCWYSAAEFAAFKRDVVTTAYLLQKEPQRVDDIHYTRRGSEHRLKEVQDRRNRVRWLAKSAVVEEQDEVTPENWDSLALFYQRVSMPAVYEAIEAASKDQADASEYQMESWPRAQETNIPDFFGDDWIRSLATVASSTSLLDQSTRQDSLLDDDFGFDCTWLKNAVMA